MSRYSRRRRALIRDRLYTDLVTATSIEYHPREVASDSIGEPALLNHCFTYPTMSSNISALAEQIHAIHTNTPDVERSQDARAALLQSARELVAALEQPDEVVSLLAFSGGRNMCVRIAIEMKLFDVLSASAQPMTAEQLSDECHAEEAIVMRIARTLVGMGFVSQARLPDGEVAFGATALTRQMTKPSVKAGVKFLFVALHQEIAW